jgi:hypothetical protein
MSRAKVELVLADLDRRLRRSSPIASRSGRRQIKTAASSAD